MISTLLKNLDLSFSLYKLKDHLLYFFPLFFNKTQYIAEDGSIKFYLRPRTWDLYVYSEIFHEMTYLDKSFYPENIETVVDLGANIGLFTLWVAHKYNPEKIVSVEMDKENFDLLKRNVDLNKYSLKPDVTLVNKAIYSKDSSVSYLKIPFNKGMHRISEVESTETSEAISFKTLLKISNLKTISLLKIDIEGSERFLFNDENKGIFTKKVKYIAMEIHPNEDFKVQDVQKYFEGLDFRCVIRDEWRSVNTIMFCENNKKAKA